MTEEGILGQRILLYGLKKGFRKFMQAHYLLCEIIYRHLLI